MRTGSKIGASISNWKSETMPVSGIARILSKVGGLIGSAVEIIAALGLIAVGITKGNQNFWQLVGLYVVGLIVDLGTHWIAIQIDKKKSAR